MSHLLKFKTKPSHTYAKSSHKHSIKIEKLTKDCSSRHRQRRLMYGSTFITKKTMIVSNTINNNIYIFCVRYIIKLRAKKKTKQKKQKIVQQTSKPSKNKLDDACQRRKAHGCQRIVYVHNTVFGNRHTTIKR